MEKQDICSINTETEIIPKLRVQIPSMGELKTYLRLKFQDNKEAGYVAGISATRVRQILVGYKIPKSPALIRKIANGWDIDEIKLTQLFESVRDDYHPVEKIETKTPEQEFDELMNEAGIKKEDENEN